MISAKEYYNTTSQGYVEKWKRIDSDLNDPRNYFRRKLIQRVIELAHIKPGEKVIEIGCGTGLVLKELLKYVKQVYGTDVSPEMLKRVQDSVLSERKVVIVDTFKNIDNLIGADAVLLENDILDLNLPKNCFDKILSLEVFRYIKETELALKNVAEIMKNSDSVFVFTVTNQFSSDLFPLKFSIREMLGLVDSEKEIMQYFVTENSVKKAINQAGLRIVGFERFDKKLERLPFLKPFFDTFIIAAKKGKCD